MSSEDLGKLPYDCYLYPGETPLEQHSSCNIFKYIDYVIGMDNNAHSTIGPASIEFKNDKVERLEFGFNGALSRVDGPTVISFHNGKVETESWANSDRIGYLPRVIEYHSDGRISEVGYGIPNTWGEFTDCDLGPSTVKYYYKDDIVTIEKYFYVKNTFLGRDLNLHSPEEIQMFYQNFKIL